MTELQELEMLRKTVSLMTMKANAGSCQFSAAGKHEFLRDIARLGREAGYDILGYPIKESR